MSSAYATLVGGGSYNTLSYWPMNDASGSTMVAGIGSNGSYTGSPTLGGGGGVSGESPNTCATFNGTSQAASGSITVSTHNQLTLCFWLNLNTSSNVVTVESSTNYGSNNGTFIFDPNATAGHHEFGMLSAGNFTAGKIVAPSNSAWHFYAACFDLSVANGAITTYVDGSSVSFTYSAQTATAANFTNQTLYLMARAASSIWTTGSMQDVTLHSGLLSSGQISTMYSTGTGSGSPAPLWTPQYGPAM